MDPVALIVMALAVGAVAGVKAGAENIKASYIELKELVQRKYVHLNVALLELESDPGSGPKQETLREGLVEAGAQNDEDARVRAERLIDWVLGYGVPKTEPGMIHGRGITSEEIDAIIVVNDHIVIHLGAKVPEIDPSVRADFRVNKNGELVRADPVFQIGASAPAREASEKGRQAYRDGEAGAIPSLLDQFLRPLISSSKKLPAEDLDLSITHPKLLSKGRSSRFMVRIFPSGQRKMVEKKIEQERKDRELQEHVGETELTAGLSVVVALGSSPVEFWPEKVVKGLKEKINAFEFTGTPKDDCVPGEHPIRLSITDEKTGHEYDYEPRTFNVEIVDFAFDGVSRPLLLKVFSGLSFLVGTITGALTFLGQVDKVLGWPAGTAFLVGGGLLGQRFWSRYRRVTEEHAS